MFVVLRFVVVCAASELWPLSLPREWIWRGHDKIGFNFYGGLPSVRRQSATSIQHCSSLLLFAAATPLPLLDGLTTGGRTGIYLRKLDWTADCC